MYALIIAALLASDVPLLWVARHPAALTALAHRIEDELGEIAKWPGRFTSGVRYHHAGKARHALRATDTTVTAAIEAPPPLPALPAGGTA